MLTRYDTTNELTIQLMQCINKNLEEIHSQLERMNDNESDQVFLDLVYLDCMMRDLDYQ
jgi:hypothetical protein